MLTIVTAAVGGYDTPRTHAPQSVPCRWVTIVQDAADDPLMAAKRVKVFPWEFGVESLSLWIDANLEIVSPDFAEYVLALLDRGDVAQWPHFAHDCFYEEADKLLSLVRVRSQHGAIRRQAEAYRAEGHPEHWGQWETGVLARHHSERVRQMSAEWWEEMRRYSQRDQLSWSRVLHRNGMRPIEMEGTRMDNPWVTTHGHRSE